MTFLRLPLLLLTLILAIAAQAQMTTATLSPTADTYVESGSTADNSAGTSLYADITSTSIRRSYLKFDIASLNIPTNAIIYSAYLKLPIQTEYVNPVTIAVKRATSSWSASTITYATQPALETSDASYTSDTSGGYRRIQITAQVQKMANMPALDHGFCVHRYNEAGSVRLYQYHSNENSGTKPVLEINYYIPFYVANATIVHASSAVAADASITPLISGGQGGTVSYQWYNSSGSAISGATSLALSGVSYGWYGLKISSTIGDPVYVAFMVAVNCGEVDIVFEPGPFYINDAMLYDRVAGGIDYRTYNYGTNIRIRTENNSLPDWYGQRSLMHFNLWMDPNINIIQSDLTLAAESHNNTRPNISEVLLATQPWNENTVTHGMGITTTTSGRIEFPATASSAENGIIDLKNYWDLWKQDNTQNYGFLVQLTLFDNTTISRRSYHSSDATDTTKLPYITFKVSLPVEEQNLIAYNYFDALGTGWSYTIGSPTYAGTGTSGTDVTGVKVIDGNKVMSKSYSTGNSTGQKVSTNTVTFSNITGLDAYDQVDFDFELASLGTATSDAGVDTGEDCKLEISTDNGNTWVNVLSAAGGSNLLFGLAATPVTELNLLSTHAWTSGESHYKLKLEGVTQLKFRFTATNNRTNENWVLDNIKLTGIDLPLSSKWDDEAGSGEITFNYENACTSVAPYTYKISELPIPPMKETYRYLKDSIYGGVLDSATFFLGHDHLLNYSFQVLPIGHYYIAVFDSRGELVYGGEKSVGPPLNLISATNMAVHENKFTALETGAKALLGMYADETTRGGMQIKPNGITGTQSFGFISVNRQLFEMDTPTITDQVGISVSGGSITRTAAGSSWGGGGGASVETVLESGYIEWTLGGTTSDNRNIMVGLSYENTDAHYNTIDYAWYTYTSGINAYVDGALPAGHAYGQFPGLAMGDVLKLERKDNNILYYQNGVLLYTAADKHPLTPMVVDFALVASGRKIYDLKIRRSSEYAPANDFAGYSQFEEGFHMIDEKVYTVKKGVLSSSYVTATANSTLQIMYEEGVVNFMLDGNVVDTETPPSSFKVEFAAKGGSKGPFFLRPIRLNLYQFHLFTSTVNNGECDDNNGSFTFDVIPYFYPVTPYDYVVKDWTGTTVASGSHTTSTFLSPNPETVNVSEAGMYTLILTSTALPGAIITKTIFVGVESDWTQVDKYTLSPNSYSLKRDATSTGTFSKAMSRNALPEGDTGWIRFKAMTANTGNSTKNYLTFSNSSVTGIPGATETFLEFHYQAAMSIGMQAGVYMRYKFPGGAPQISVIPVNAQVTVLFTLANIIVKANDVTVATLPRPSGIIQLKANSNKVNQGFQDLITSFGCTVGDEIYAGLKYKLDGYYHIMLDGKIRFEYEEEYSAADLKFNIYDNMDQLVKTQSDFPAYTTSHGPNMITLDVSDDAHCIGSKYFYLEVINEKKEKFYLRFYNNYNGCN